MRSPIHVQRARNTLRLACGFPGAGFAISTGLACGHPSVTVLRVLESATGYKDRQGFNGCGSPIFLPFDNTRSR